MLFLDYCTYKNTKGKKYRCKLVSLELFTYTNVKKIFNDIFNKIFLFYYTFYLIQNLFM